MSSSITVSKTNKSDNIDFDFFENEDSITKVYSKQKQSGSSKIITKAVIEAEPDVFENTIQKHTRHNSVAQYRKKSDCLSSPSSSLERKLLGLEDATRDTLMNCLAYNDDDRLNNTISTSPYSCDIKDSSDNSLSDSTVTSITSDFTSISPLFSSSLSSSSSCNNLSEDYEESFAVGESKPESLRSTDLTALSDLTGNFEPEQSNAIIEVSVDELNETDEVNTVSSKNSTVSKYDGNDQNLKSQDENSNSAEAYESDFESYSEINYLEKNCDGGETIERNVGGQIISPSDKDSHVSTLEDELGDISLSQSRSSSVKTSYKKRKNLNLTFSREELIRIERDNLILLKKIMAHSKHKPVLLNQQPFSHKKTSTAINRAKLQKKIEQDNYILYSKISAMNRLKKVF